MNEKQMNKIAVILTDRSSHGWFCDLLGTSLKQSLTLHPEFYTTGMTVYSKNNCMLYVWYGTDDFHSRMGFINKNAKKVYFLIRQPHLDHSSHMDLLHAYSQKCNKIIHVSYQSDSKGVDRLVNMMTEEC